MNNIIVYNIRTDDFSNKPNNYYVGRSKSGNPLGNPFTHNGVRKSIAKLSFKTREEAIEAYKIYFKKMYGGDNDLTKSFDEIYEHYKKGEDIYLGCFCKPLPCHADFLAEELQKKLIKEKMEERKREAKE
jgi:hypothetical protein